MGITLFLTKRLQCKLFISIPIPNSTKRCRSLRCPPWGGHVSKLEIIQRITVVHGIHHRSNWCKSRLLHKKSATTGNGFWGLVFQMMFLWRYIWHDVEVEEVDNRSPNLASNSFKFVILGFNLEILVFLSVLVVLDYGRCWLLENKRLLFGLNFLCFAALYYVLEDFGIVLSAKGVIKNYFESTTQESMAFHPWSYCMPLKF